RLRMVKQPAELQALQSAIDATTKAITHVQNKYLAGKYTHEFDIQLDLDREYWKSGAQGHSFAPIIAGGERGLTLHVTDKQSLDHSKQLLIGVGAEYDHYAADISRTWMRQPTKRFSLVKSAVSEVSDYAMSLLKPGVVLKDYEQQIESFMGEKLREL